MKKFDFLAVSLVFHAAVVVTALLIPPPFPSGQGNGDDKGLTYVELRHVKDRAARRAKKPVVSAFDAPVKFTDMPLPAALFAENDTGQAPAIKPVKIPAKRRRIKGRAPAREKSPATPPPEFAPVPDERAEPEKPPENPPEKPIEVEARPVKEAHPVKEAPAMKGIEADKTSISFKYQKGWPVPAMVRVKVVTAGGGGGAGVQFRAAPDSGWIIVSPVSGVTPGVMKVGVDTSKLSLGYREGVIGINPTRPGAPGAQVSVSIMVLPKSPGVPELPHYAWDSYMNGDCKVCHMPKELMPSGGFMYQPEFCGLCHNPSGTAKDKTIGGGGHPVLVAAGSGGTKYPTIGSVPSGDKSDRMATHLKDRKLVVCVTCHNVMEKPGDYGRTWEIASSGDRRRFYLSKGGWENMGYLEPKVYVTPGLMKIPRYLSELRKYEVDRGEYGYDEAEGVIAFKRPRDKDEAVYVTLDNPYLRVTTEDNRLCFDCHSENTHQGINCLTCHVMHGTSNIMCVRQSVRTQDSSGRKVVFKSFKGKDSFADGGSARDGICDACHDAHTKHKDGKDYAGTDCTKCHTHKDGFAMQVF